MSIEVLKQALAALKEYGSHFPYCTQYPTYTRPELEPPCGCGFDMATATLRQAIEQAESKSASDCDSPSWCNQYGKCHRSVIGAPMLANCIQGQEPVAVLMDGELFTMAEYEVIAEQGDGAKPLYVAPPKREWVGLTYEEISASVDICEQNVKGEFLVDYARAIEAKLREKNGF